MTAAVEPGARSAWRSVVLPNEHGGWGLTLEPALLGLLVAPGLAGVLLGLAAFAAFLLRTPAKLVAVDRRRGRCLPRTRLATRVAVVELIGLLALVAGAVALSGPAPLVPLAAAAPLVGVELWFDVRSRGRRLVPEVAGAVGIGSVAAAVALAGGTSAVLGLGLWLVLAARAVTSIPYVRSRVVQLHGRAPDRRSVLAGDLAALMAAGLAVAVDRSVLAGALAVVAVVVFQRSEAGRPVDRAAVIGMRQMVLGLAVVLIAAAGVLFGAGT